MDDFLFAADSAIWQINRERALLLTGMRVLLMQIAHPMVAEAVYDHSYVFKNPLRRLLRTLNLTLTLVYGTQAEVQHALSEIEKAHRPAVGRLEQAVGKHPAGTTYNARNPRQALWVYATLVEGAISGYEYLVAPLTESTKQEFYENSATIAALMNIRPSYLPSSYADLLVYMQEAIDCQEIAVSPKAREIAPFITAQSIPALNILSYPLFRFSVGLLPPPLIAQYGYHLADWEQNLAQRFGHLSRVIVPRIPAFLRFAPEYRRAIRTLSAK